MARKKRDYEKYKEYYRRKREEASQKRIEAVLAAHPAPEWLPIPGFSAYLVNKKGDIINKYGRKIKPGIVKSNNYLHVMLTDDNGRSRHIYVHQAVWFAFIGSDLGKKKICHLDANPRNNKLDNLKLMTVCENLNKSVTRLNRMVSRQNMAEIPGKNVITYKYDLDHVLIKTYDSVKQVAEDGHSVGAVSMCCNGRQKTHHGYIFTHKRLADEATVTANVVAETK